MNNISSLVTEKLIILGKKAYPNNGHVVIMAGGSAAGKGTVINSLLGVEGKVLDVDELKELVLRSKKFHEIVKSEFGVEVSSLNLKTPKDVYLLHNIVKQLDLPNKKNMSLYTSILTQSQKPNLIFDITLKDFESLHEISLDAQRMGYSKENIHIVWVINELSTSLRFNRNRKRVVPDEVVISSHTGVSLTMKQIVKMGTRLEEYMDGDIVFVFNKIGVDTSAEFSKYGGSYVTKSDYFKVKSQNQNVSAEAITLDVKRKIMEYIPEISW